MRTLTFAVLALLSVPAAARAQDDPLTTHSKFMFTVLKDILVLSAEKMPEEHYAFKPTEAVRSFGQIVGHVADAQYLYCSALAGEKNPAPRVEQTMTTKAALVGALKEALAYCDRAYARVTGANAAEIINFGRATPKVSMITVNLVHATEHYGNLVTYLRMKNLVPPTSAPGFLARYSGK